MHATRAGFFGRRTENLVSCSTAPFWGMARCSCCRRRNGGAAVEVGQRIDPGHKRFVTPSGCRWEARGAGKEPKHESFCTRGDGGRGELGGDRAGRDGGAVAPWHEQA